MTKSADWRVVLGELLPDPETQCGYCQSGQMMQAASLVDKQQPVTDEQIESHMSGNICRCGTYPRIRAAVKSAAESIAVKVTK